MLFCIFCSVASLVTITLPIGSIIVGPLMDKFGRKTVCLLSCIPAAISWVSLIFAKSLITIYAARVIAGIAAGLTTVGLVYISELSHPQVRPMLLCLNSVFVSLGILITCCLAVLLDWRKMAMIFLALECCIFFALYFVPESPYWLVCFTNGMFDEKRICKMKRSLKRLNRRQTVSTVVSQYLLHTQNIFNRQTFSRFTSKNTRESWRRMETKRAMKGQKI